MRATSVFCFQAEDGIRYLVRSRGLGDVYKRQRIKRPDRDRARRRAAHKIKGPEGDPALGWHQHQDCLLYTSDAADERSSVDLGGRRIIKQKRTCKMYGR